MKRLNNKVLIVAFLILVTAFVLTKLFRSPARESNLDADLLTVDTSKVTELKLYPIIDQRKEIKFVKELKNWNVHQDSVTAKAETFAVSNLLRTLAQLKPERILSRKKEKWDEYKVSDSTGIHVVALEGKSVLTDLWIGKENGNLTYIRQGKEDEVYAIASDLRTLVDKDFNYWRDKSFLRLGPEQVSRINFQYPADSSFVLEKRDKAWWIGNEKADSVKTETYLGQLRFKNLSSFADYFSPRSAADVTITMEGSTGVLGKIQAWRELTDKWILNSSLQPRVYFLEEHSGIDLFAGRKRFLSSKKKRG
jgi:hypothetical protein